MREGREGHAKSEHANVASYALRVTLSLQGPEQGRTHRTVFRWSGPTAWERAGCTSRRTAGSVYLQSGLPVISHFDSVKHSHA